MELVLAKSGGADVWSRVQSSKEVLKVSSEGVEAFKIQHFLDDWSTGVTRYRRGSSGMKAAPEDHSGNATFKASVGARTIEVPEFDQARTVVGRLPAAAAEIMLRNDNYVLKIASSRSCDSGNVCIDVFEKQGAGLPIVPEQQWTISSDTGFPTSIASMVLALGPPQLSRWRVVRFLEYGTQAGVIIPVSMEVAGAVSAKQTWTLISFNPNSGFDTETFDQEIAK